VRAIIRIVRGTIGAGLAVTLLTLAIGLQAVEATGHWDRSFEDTADEAVIVTLVLCVGAALVVAAATRPRISLSAMHAPVVIRLATALAPCPALGAAACNTSPPLSLRI
jgi:hypothetical protein